MEHGRKIAREIKTITVMVGIYCRGHHGSRGEQLCDECNALLDYARERLEKCPFGADKGPCSKCEIHCYKPEMRERVVEVMRYAGPRMVTKHPILAADHLIKSKRGGRKRQ